MIIDQHKIDEAVQTIIENGGHGSSAAAPVARALFDAYLIGKMPEPEPAAGTTP